jgi:hypothetical protein
MLALPLSTTIGVAKPVDASIEYNTAGSLLDRPTNPSGKDCACEEPAESMLHKTNIDIK